MSQGLEFTITPRTHSADGYDWVDLDLPEARVGKMRCRLDPDRAIVFTVMVFPEFQGKGYGRQVIDLLKARYPVVEADRVRHTAVWFWEKMGFHERPDGNWEFRRS